MTWNEGIWIGYMLEVIYLYASSNSLALYDVKIQETYLDP